MGKYTKQERVRLCSDILRLCEESPHSLSEIIIATKVEPNLLKPLLRVLRKNDFLVYHDHEYAATVGSSWDDNSIREVLGYELVDVPHEHRCSDCGEMKTRIKLSSGRIVDEKDRPWKNSMCPDCKLATCHNYEEKEPLTDRKCRQCKSQLPVSRYFDCYNCVPELEDIDDAFIYHVEETYEDLDLMQFLGD